MAGKWYAFENPVTKTLRAEHPWDFDAEGQDGETRVYFDSRQGLREERRKRAVLNTIPKDLLQTSTMTGPYGSGMTTMARIFNREVPEYTKPLRVTDGVQRMVIRDTAEIDVEIVGETEFAIRVSDGETKAWIPKSALKKTDEGFLGPDDAKVGKSGTIAISQGLAELKELV